MELKRRIGKANFYGAEARDFDDKMAQAKLKRYQKNAVDIQNNKTIVTEIPIKTREEIRKELGNDVVDEKKMVKIEVLKNIKDVKNGYYIVANIFTEAKPRDEFTLKLTDSGEVNSNFFFNINIFSYYVFSKSFNYVDEALYECKQKAGNPLFENMFIAQIENE